MLISAQLSGGVGPVQFAGGGHNDALMMALVLGALAPAEVARVLALGIRRARDELAEPAPPLLERFAALRARLARLHAGLDPRHLLLGAFQVALEGRVERLDRVGPLPLPVLHAVELVLHLGRELDVHDLGEERLEQVRDLDAEVGREQLGLQLHHQRRIDHLA